MAKNNSNLRKADGAKKDEFYTQLADIEKQVFRYGVDMGHFKDKVILLPCDESQHTNFYKHFMMNREEYGWKKLIAVGYRNNHPAEAHVIVVGKNGMQEKNEPLKGNGDFRNKETLKFFDECDVVVTNPPFSLFREFVSLLIQKNKKFLIIGNQNAITYKEIFPLIKQNKLWFGYSFNKTMEFKVIDDYDHYTRIDYDEKGKKIKIGKVPAICWFTNMHIKKREVKLNTSIDFEHGMKMGWYQKYDNYDAINVNKTCQIPIDYDGVMGVPITFLDKYNPEQFEIIGLFNRYSECDYENGFICGNKAEYVEKDNKVLRSAGPVVNRKAMYARILIKAKR